MKKISVAGIIILVSVSPLFRGLMFSYETNAFIAAIGLLSAIYFFVKMLNNEPVRVNKWIVVFSILLVGASVLSFITAVNARENLESVLQYVEYLMVFLVLYDYYADRKQQLIKMVMMPVATAGFVCAVTALMVLAGAFNILDIINNGGRIGATFQYANTASIYFAICLLFALTLVNSLKSNILKALLAGAGNTIALALFLTGSRGGYLVGFGAVLLLFVLQPSGHRIRGIINFIFTILPVFVAMKGFNSAVAAHDSLAAIRWLAISFALAAALVFLYIMLSKIIFKDKTISMSKGSGILIAAGIGAAILLAVIFRDRLFGILPPSIAGRLARFNMNDINVLYRLDFDKDALKLLKDHWLLGLGGGGWKAMYQSVQEYFYTAKVVHNNYLQVFAESGILGFISYLGIVVAGVVNAVYSWLKATDKNLKIYSAGLLCAFLALAAHSSFDFDLSFISMMLLLWVMLAAASTGSGPETGKSFLFMREWKIDFKYGLDKMVMIVLCAVIFSINALYFTGSLNEREGLKQLEAKNFESAMVFFQEANRLDPMNAAYTFELAKLYNYFADESKAEEDKGSWLEKARQAGEFSVNGNKGYPVYMNTLVQIYLDSDMPLQALEYSQKLVTAQPYNSKVYELLAESSIAAASYYEKNGDADKARELLGKCLEIGSNPQLLKSNIDKPIKVMKQKDINNYKHSERLKELLELAANKYK